MNSTISQSSPHDLQEAFALFNQVSEQLTNAYEELQAKAEGLTQELAIANGALRKQFEEKQALSQRLSQLLDALPGGVVVLDAEGRVEDANPAAKAFLGASLMGMCWQKVQEHSLTSTLTTGEWVLKEGERRVSISRSMLEGTAGAILLMQDITEAHAMEAQLQRHKRLSAMGEMAAALAHQLRTPLSTALLYTSHLRDATLGEDERKRFAEKALGRLRHLEALIKDMLVFVRGGKGTQERMQVADIVHEVQQLMEPQMLQHGIEFEVEMQVGREVIQGSREAITGALGNLLANASQACAGSGKVSLVSGIQDGKWVSFNVRDNGKGISPEILERLFEPFFTTRTEGTGLGLAIVREVVQIHGGDVTVSSEVGVGSDFCIRFPLITQ